jgi:Na+/melibiose symporter-like transporter
MLLLLFYNQVVGLDPRVVSSAILITMFVDSVVDPLLGQVSDNFRSKLGRRHPFMYMASIPVSVTFFLIWNPPVGMTEAATFAYLLTCLLIIRAFDTFFELPSMALAPELAADYDERTRLLALRAMFGAIGTLSVSILVYQVFMRQNADGSGGVTERAGYFGFSLCAAILIFTIIITSATGTVKQIPYLAKPAARTDFKVLSILREVFQTMRNRNFAVVAVAGMVLAIGSGIQQSLNIYIGLFYWQLDQNQLTAIAIATVLANFVGVWLAPRMVKRFGKRVGALITGWISIAFMVAPISLDQFGLMPPRDSTELFVALVVAAFFTQALASATGVKIQAMIADVVEDAAAKTGRRSEGLLFSADSLFKKAVSGIGVLVAGQMLYLTNFPENARQVGVSLEIANHLGLMAVFSWLTFNGGCLVALSFYGITREKHAANLSALAAKSRDADQHATSLEEAPVLPVAGATPASQPT